MSMLIWLVARVCKGGIWIHLDSLGFIWIHLKSVFILIFDPHVATTQGHRGHRGHLSYCHANSIGGKLVAGDQSGRHCGVQPDAAQPVG